MVGVSESHNIAVLVLLIIISCFLLSCKCSNVEGVKVVQREQRKSLTVTDDGEVTAVDINHPLPYTLHFFTLEPNSLFLPVLLHAHMLFYVHTGSGELSWADEEQTRKVDIKRGDLYSLNPGSVFYVHSNLEPERQKLRFYAIFANTDEDQYEPSIGAYSRISDMITGFDGKILQAAFKVPEEVVEEMINATSPPPIVHAVPPKETTTSWEWEARFEKAFLSGRKPVIEMNGKKKKKKYEPFNIYDAKPDFSNCNGWSLSVNNRNLMKDSNVGVFMVNLTKGSMMGPHWNPMATEVSIVLEGEGMIRIGGSSSNFSVKDKGCKSMRFKVKEGDVFIVPRFHPMAQISFNNGSFVFMGFSTAVKKNYPQFMAGKRSVLRVLDNAVLAASFNVTNSTIDQLLAAQEESIILDCTSCAEEEEMKMKEEIEREKQKEEEEEARKKEEEEARKRREEEEARKREEAREREREEKEEEARKRREEEEARKREEEEAREREREEKEEEARRKEQEEARRKEEEEKEKREEEKRQREQEREEEAKRREEAEREEEKRRREQEREEEAEREEEKRQREQEREEEARRQEEEEAEREEEMRREEEARRRKEEEMREEEKRRREQEREEEARRQEEEAAEREREEAAEREEEEEKETQPEERESEQEAARRQEKERIEREKQEEAAARAREKEKAKEDPEEPQKVNSSAERLRIMKFASYIV